nr:hypothetical protein [Lunatimonas salinarum]
MPKKPAIDIGKVIQVVRDVLTLIDWRIQDLKKPIQVHVQITPVCLRVRSNRPGKLLVLENIGILCKKAEQQTRKEHIESMDEFRRCVRIVLSDFVIQSGHFFRCPDICWILLCILGLFHSCPWKEEV